MSNKLELSREEFEEDILYTAKTVILDRIIDHSRWSVTHEVIFQRDGKLWQALYDRAATEYQDNENPDTIECREVREIPSVDYEVIP